MTHIVFENAGEIDPLLITTFGVNVKEIDNAIGFFGTGLKYALSILMRSGCEVVIQSGAQEFRFSKKAVQLRGKPFEFVTMNDEPLGFTTEVGKTWELWMAYRELFCNAQDEGGRTYKVDEYPTAESGITRVIVSGEPFVEVAKDHGRYFLNSTPFLQTPYCNIHHGAGRGIYYRSVFVGALSPRPMLYTYNVAGHLDLTEDRTMKESYAVGWHIAEAINQCDDREVIRAAVTAPDGFHEHYMDFDYGGEPSAAFFEVVGGLIRDRIGKVNTTAIEKYKKHMRAEFLPDPIELNAIERAALERAKAFCHRIGFDIKYPIIPVESLGSDILGMAMQDRIYIAQRAFMIGTKCVAGTLCEEYIHLKHGHGDNTRAMQNYLIDRMVSLGELVTGEPL